MSDRQTFRLVHDVARNRAVSAVFSAEEGMVVTIRKPNRSLDQNAKAHALFHDIAKARPKWNGIEMDADDWKALLIVSHAVATGDGMRMMPDLEGKGFVQLRESSATMTVSRAASLIDYIEAWAVGEGIPLQDPTPKGER